MSAPVKEQRWTSDGQGNVLTITETITYEDLADWLKAARHIPSYFVIGERTFTPDGVRFVFKRPDQP